LPRKERRVGWQRLRRRFVGLAAMQAMAGAVKAAVAVAAAAGTGET